MLDFNTIPRKERVIVALDCDRSRALELADMLAGKATWSNRYDPVLSGRPLFYYCLTKKRVQGFS